MKTFRQFICCFCLVCISMPGFSQTTIQKVMTEKNAGISFTLSALLPGAGQMYNGQVIIGLATFAVIPTLMVSGTLLINNYNQYPENNEGNRTLGTALIVVGSLAYVVQLVQAPLYSQVWNKKNGFEARNLSSLELNANASGFTLCYRF
jgi:TM2 domain-containing membrane protein YozV